MRQPAIDDYIETVLGTWYSTVATGDVGAAEETCARCTASVVHDALALSAWPHPAVHPLIEVIDTVIRAVAISLDEEDLDGLRHDRWAEAAPRPHDHDEQAARHVLGRVLEHRCDIEDVLVNCVPLQASAC